MTVLALLSRIVTRSPRLAHAMRFAERSTKFVPTSRVTVSPEVLIVLLDSLSNFTQSVCGNNERQFFFAHK
jgi:hypothetical protein